MLHLLSRPFAWLDEWQERPLYFLYAIVYCVIGCIVWVGAFALLFWLVDSVLM